MPTYYALAFAISWGGIIIVVGPGGVTGTTKPPDVLLPFVYLAMLAGPISPCKSPAGADRRK